MNALLEQVVSVHGFVDFVAQLRDTGSGWTIIGDEPFAGESSRLVLVDDLAAKAKELLQAKFTERTMHDLLVKPHL